MTPITGDRHEARALVRGLQVLLAAIQDRPTDHGLTSLECIHMQAVLYRVYSELLEDQRIAVAEDLGFRVRRETAGERFWRETDERRGTDRSAA